MYFVCDVVKCEFIFIAEMAAVSDCFSIGSTVACTTCFNQNIEGEVLAFDQSTKMLILKCPSRDTAKLSDVYIVNLSLCSDVQVKKEVSTIPEAAPQQSLNLQRLSTRVRNAVEQKKRLVSALAAGVSPEGQKLYMFISKTINQVMWSGPNIVVFNDVTINPPYKKENVNGNKDSREFLYIQKIVEKFTKDQAAATAATAVNSMSSAVGSSASSSSVASSTSASTVSAN